MSHTAWPGLHSAPAFRSIDMLSGANARPSAFFAALNEANRRVTDAQVQRDDFARAVGFYSCPCGSEFEFTEDSTLEDYAALNRWLGTHFGDCSVLLRAELEELRGGLAAGIAKACTR
jgi:hypothetical protein